MSRLLGTFPWVCGIRCSSQTGRGQCLSLETACEEGHTGLRREEVDTENSLISAETGQPCPSTIWGTVWSVRQQGGIPHDVRKNLYEVRVSHPTELCPTNMLTLLHRSHYIGIKYTLLNRINLSHSFNHWDYKCTSRNFILIFIKCVYR